MTNIRQWLQRRRKQNKAIKELQSLDDNSLRDLGIDRSRIVEVVRKFG